MPWWSKKSEPLALESLAEIYIGAGVQASGKIETPTDVFIDGEFKGTINCQALVEIGKNAKVNSHIKGRSLVIDGSLQGKADIQEEISAHNCSEIQADLKSPTLVMDKGALMQGNVTITR